MKRRMGENRTQKIVFSHENGPDRIRTCNQGIMLTTSAFAANRAVVRGLDCAFAGEILLTASPCPVSTPSRVRGLGSALALGECLYPLAFTEVTEIQRPTFARRDPMRRNCRRTWHVVGRYDLRNSTPVKSPALPLSYRPLELP